MLKFYPTNLNVEIISINQPAINNTPPIGVIAPKIRICVKANIYNEPLKNTTPRKRSQPAPIHINRCCTTNNTNND